MIVVVIFMLFSTVNILQQQIFILYGNLSENKKNCEIIATQIWPDIENS